jgi:ParB family chromosome partitioning protein
MPNVTPFRINPMPPLATPGLAPAIPAPAAVTPTPARPPQPAPIAASVAAAAPERLAPPFDGPVVPVAVAMLEPGTCGTRRAGNDAPVATLTASIATSGVRRPLLARRLAGPGERYEIVAGLRRWRAAERIGLTEVPTIIATLSDAEAVLASLSENLEHEDFSPVEEARAYLRLLTEFSMNAADITAASGRERQHVVRTMRLLGLPPRVRDLLEAREISAGHGLALLDAGDPEAMADAIVAGRLSIEETRHRIAASPAGSVP